MTAAPDLDPYLLPHLTGALHGHLNGRYADPVWPLAPLTDNPSDLRQTIRWDQWPAAFRDEMKAAAWNLINGHLRPTIQRGHGTRMRSRLGTKTIQETARQWRLLASWLDNRGIRTLAGCLTRPGPAGQGGRCGGSQP